MKFNLKFSSMEKYFDSIQTIDQLYCDLTFPQNVLTQRNKSSLLVHHQFAHLYNMLNSSIIHYMCDVEINFVGMNLHVFLATLEDLTIDQSIVNC